MISRHRGHIPISETPTSKQASLRYFVLWLPLLTFGGIVILSLWNPDQFLVIATQLNDVVLSIFSNAFAFAAFAFVLICLWAAVSPLGRIKIGGEDAEPLLSRWN